MDTEQNIDTTRPSSQVRVGDYYLLLFYLLSIIYLEMVMVFSFSNSPVDSVSVYLILFSVPIAFFFFLISTLFKKNVNKIISITLFSLITLLFSIQTVYHSIFDIYLSVYLASNEGEALQFVSVIFSNIIKSGVSLIMIFIPLLILIIFGRKKWFKNDGYYKSSIIIGFCLVITHVTCVASLPLTGDSFASPNNLYYNSISLDNSVSKLGLLTTSRIDLQRNIIGFEEKFVIQEEDSIEIEPENVKKVYEANMLDIDFESLKASTDDIALQETHEYFSKQEPTYQNEKTGECIDFNLIMIVAESFSPFAISEEKTPTLYKMQQEGYNFTNFYNAYWEGSTLAGEYGAVSGLLPENDDGYLSFNKMKDNNFYYAMGNQLKREGYLTYAFHANTYNYYDRQLTHPAMGYEYFGKGNGLELEHPDYWPQSDVETIEASTPFYLGKNNPFHAYYMTISGHCNYNFDGNMMSYKNKSLVDDMNLSTEAKAYIACNIEFDKSLELLMQKLEEAGVAENTLIMITPDHYPYEMSKNAYDELAGHEIDRNLEVYKSTLIMYYKGMTAETIDTPCSSVDILPTLSNLMGLEYDSRLMSGKDIFSTAEHIVFLKGRSWLTDKAYYNATDNTATPVNGATVYDEYIDRISNIVSNRFAFAKRIVDYDYYALVFG